MSEEQKPEWNVSIKTIWKAGVPILGLNHREMVNEFMQLIPQWIDVKDKLPDFEVKVLVFGESIGMNPQMGGAYHMITQRKDLPEKFSRMQDENQFMNMRYVTHWMPLPEKPIIPKPEL